MPVESRDDLVKRLRDTAAFAEGRLEDELLEAATRIASDAKRIAELEAEREKLRAIISASATAIGNGAMLSPECSIDFMEGLPEEISKYTDKLRRFLKCSRDEGGEVLERADRALAEETERCAVIAERHAYCHPNAGTLGPEMNSMAIATAIRSGKTDRKE